jgi:hypothetical protein
MLNISKTWLIIFLIVLVALWRVFQPKKAMNRAELRKRTAELLQGRGLKQKDIDILADNISRQGYHETGGFDSTIFKDNRNYFGMKASSRDYDKGTVHGHAYYNTYDDSIKDIIDYMSERKGGLKSFVLDLAGYAKRLKDLNYYEDSYLNYYNGLKNAK